MNLNRGGGLGLLSISVLFTTSFNSGGDGGAKAPSAPLITKPLCVDPHA